MSDRESFFAKVVYPGTVGLVAIGVLLVFVVVPSVYSAPSRLIGHPAPDFSLDVVHNGDAGNRVRLSELKGHAVILDFFAHWCGPCQIEAPILDRVAQRHRGSGLVVVGINTNDPPGYGAQFARQKRLSYPIVYDDGDRVAARYAVSGLPTLVVIDSKGDVIAVRSGVENEAELDRLVGQAL
jgi:thiol-disulfide isomerase/thioredoxin